MALQFIGVLAGSVVGDGVTTSFTITIQGMLVANLQCGYVTIAGSNLPVAIVKATGSPIDVQSAVLLTGNQTMTLTFILPPPLNAINGYEVYLLFAHP